MKGFFAKFLFDYSSNIEAIDISSDTGFRKISEAKEIVNVCCHSEKCKKEMREKAWTFYILDPFDKGYNPAKSITKDSDMQIMYYSEMAESLIELLNGKKTLLQILQNSIA